jgi:hypothetical protein
MLSFTAQAEPKNNLDYQCRQDPYMKPCRDRDNKKWVEDEHRRALQMACIVGGRTLAQCGL